MRLEEAWCLARRAAAKARAPSGPRRLPAIIICVGSIAHPAPNRQFQARDSYWRSPESGGYWHNSRQSKETICVPSGPSRLPAISICVGSVAHPAPQSDNRLRALRATVVRQQVTSLSSDGSETTGYEPFPPASNCIDLYQNPPHYSERQKKSKGLQKAI